MCYLSGKRSFQQVHGNPRLVAHGWCRRHFISLSKRIGPRLLRSGHEVLTASSGEEALSRLQQTEVDVVVLDLNMPRMHGSEVCSEVRAHWPEVAVLIVSGTVTETDRRQLQAIGATDVLTKPLGEHDLEEAIVHAFKWHRAERASAIGRPSSELGLEIV